MELSKISTVVRPRSKWEATDLGFKMASQWARPLIYGWLMITLPFFVLLQWLLVDYGPAAILVFWWLKPFYERIQLGYLSFRLFGEESSLKQQFKRWRSLVTRQWLATLLWRRLSPHRSYLLPIVQLENLSGLARQRRLALFDGPNQQAALWLMLVCVHLESFIAIAVYALLYFLVPSEMALEASFFEALFGMPVITNCIAYIAMALVAPFYVTSGFSLYLNQRTRIEGWDIEIAFRRMVARQTTKPRQSGISKVIPLVLLSVLAFASPEPMAAQNQASQVLSQPLTQPLTRQQSKQLAQDILASETFNQKQIQKVPEFILNWELEPDEEIQPQTMPDWLATLIALLASSFEAILTAAVVAIVLLLLYRYRVWLIQFMPGRTALQRQDKQPQSIFGLDISKDQLPDDPGAQARLLWQQGQQRQALSLLYRGSLFNLVNRQHLTLHDGFTEGECVQQVKQNAQPQIAEYFQLLTTNWQRLAYADIMPKQDIMLQLFDQWHSVFMVPNND